MVTIRNSVATLCCAKNRRCESPHVTSPVAPQYGLNPVEKGDVTRDDSERRFLAQHSVATLFRIVKTLLQHRNAVLR